QLRKPTVVEHLRSIYHETVDADVLDARHVPHEPRDGVDSGMGPPAKLRLAEPLDRRVGQDLVDLRVADQHEIGRVHGGQSTKSPRRGSPRTISITEGLGSPRCGSPRTATITEGLGSPRCGSPRTATITEGLGSPRCGSPRTATITAGPGSHATM